jgi:hypothetical protein
MSKSLTDLGELCNDGPYTVNIKLGENCANDTTNEINFPDNFFIDDEDITSTVENAILNVGQTTTAKLSFDGVNGNKSFRIYKNHNNYIIQSSSASGVTVEPNTGGLTPLGEIWWDITNSSTGTITFTITTTEDWDNYVGWNVSTKVDPSSFNITWQIL